LNKIENVTDYYLRVRGFSDILDDVVGKTAMDYFGIKSLYNDAVYANYVEGNFAECGCWVGGSSYLLASVMKPNKKLFVLDSFQGLSKPSEEDLEGLEQKYIDGLVLAEGMFKQEKDKVEQLLSPTKKNIKLIEGFYSSTLVDNIDEELDNSKFALVNIDVDLCEPYRQAIDFFYPRLSVGGIMMFDEYGFAPAKNVTTLIDKFLKTINYDGFQFCNRLSIIKR
jgi:O-methyltransferase